MRLFSDIFFPDISLNFELNSTLYLKLSFDIIIQLKNNILWYQIICCDFEWGLHRICAVACDRKGMQIFYTHFWHMTASKRKTQFCCVVETTDTTSLFLLEICQKSIAKHLFTYYKHFIQVWQQWSHNNINFIFFQFCATYCREYWPFIWKIKNIYIFVNKLWEIYIKRLLVVYRSPTSGHKVFYFFYIFGWRLRETIFEKLFSLFIRKTIAEGMPPKRESNKYWTHSLRHNPRVYYIQRSERSFSSLFTTTQQKISDSKALDWSLIYSECVLSCALLSRKHSLV